jgi:hypothetical protein
MRDDNMCPRCFMTYEGRPALSRLTRGDVPERDRIYVCSDCGVLEALEQHNRGGIPHDWRGL